MKKQLVLFIGILVCGVCQARELEYVMGGAYVLKADGSRGTYLSKSELTNEEVRKSGDGFAQIVGKIGDGINKVINFFLPGD